MEKAVQYTNDTDQILDLAGSKNVVFLPKEGGWEYLLVDAVYPSQKEGRIDYAKGAFYKYCVEGKELDLKNEISGNGKY